MSPTTSGIRRPWTATLSTRWITSPGLISPLCSATPPLTSEMITMCPVCFAAWNDTPTPTVTPGGTSCPRAGARSSTTIRGGPVNAGPPPEFPAGVPGSPEAGPTTPGAGPPGERCCTTSSTLYRPDTGAAAPTGAPTGGAGGDAAAGDCSSRCGAGWLGGGAALAPSEVWAPGEVPAEAAGAAGAAGVGNSAGAGNSSEVKRRRFSRDLSARTRSSIACCSASIFGVSPVSLGGEVARGGVES
mmetsp:Transcript_11431/g.26435  ORF Transcript_11431/g.26435 Transcript_11431/m.26435 type:complete len:244 (-) Transcript_11431:127-858(-)